MNQRYNINDIKELGFSFKIGDIVFLNWGLWVGKTTISKHILNNILSVKEGITSPTYTYYNKYKWILDWKEINIYHFDLYRLNNYDEFFAIWAEEILDDNDWVILIEWPDIIKKYYNPNLIINLFKLENEDERKIEIIKK